MRLARLRNWFGRASPGNTQGLLAQATLAELSDERGGAAPSASLFPGGNRPREPGAIAGGSPVSDWSAVRVGVVEELWGEGFLNPGGEEDLLRLAAPLGLSDKTSVLLLGAGTGGGARVLAEACGAWVSGYEADETLTALASARLKKAGGNVARRATVATWNPQAPLFKRKGFHHAVALDVIHAAAPQEVLAAASLALKPGGQFVMLQMVSDAKLDSADPALAAWARLEHRAPAVPLLADVTRTLARLGYDVRVVEDVSARHMQLVLRGWAALVRTLDGPKPAPLHAAAIVREAERWMRRLRLMQAGQLRMVRWHAISRETATPK